MFLVRMIRKLFSLLRSDLTGHEVALGFSFGMLLGCIPLSSIWAVVAVLGLALVFRSSFSALLLAAIVVKSLGFAIDPLLFRLGSSALEGPLSGFFAWLIAQPVLALLDLHRYVVAGGILFSLLASVVTYPVIRLLVRKYRVTLLRWSENSAGFKRFTGFPLVKFFTWLLMGKKKGEYKETLEVRRSPIRKGTLILVSAFAVLVWVLGLIFGDAVAKAGFETGLGRATDTDVTTRIFSLSLLQGSMDMEDCYVYEEGEKDGVVSALKFGGNLSMFNLLKRQLVFEEITIENMDFRVKRDREGKLNICGEPRPPETETTDPSAGLNLGDFMQQKDLARDLVDRLVDLLFGSEEGETPEEAMLRLQEEAEKLKNYASLFADYLLNSDVPMVVIERLEVNGLKLKLQDEADKGVAQAFERLSIRASSLSSNPRLLGRDSILELGNNDLKDPTFYLKFTLNWSSPEPVHTLEIRLNDLPTEAVLGVIEPGKDLLFEGGTVSLDGSGSLRPSDMELETTFQITGVNVAPARPGAKIMGLEGSLFCQGLSAFLEETPLKTRVRIHGPYQDLDMEVDDQGLLESVKEGIQRTGDRLLQEQMDQQIGKARALANDKLEEGEARLKEKTDKLQDKLEKKLGEGVGKELGKELDGLLGGQKEEGGGLLDGLFGGKKKKQDEREGDKE